jgi:hypothetical protein
MGEIEAALIEHPQVSTRFPQRISNIVNLAVAGSGA